MRAIAMTATVFALATGAAHGSGLDRNNTPIDVIFEDGNYAELSYAVVSPSVDGRDLLGNRVADVGNDFDVFGVAMKLDFGDKLSFALIYDQPYGSDVAWGGDPATTLLGGTFATAESDALTALLKYRATERISVYGGPRMVSAKGTIGLGGQAFGPFNGFVADFDTDRGVGAVLGAAYEIPEIAFRAALTWHSEIGLSLNTTENFPAAAAPALPPGTPTGVPLFTGRTKTEIPQSVKLALQSGVARNTLVFGSVRWSEWEKLTLVTPALGSNLSDLDNFLTYEIGVGHRFTERFSASISYTLDDSSGDDLVSPLAPTDGQQAVSLGAKFRLNETITLSGGVRYSWLGDALPETGTPDMPRATFDNNDAISAGVKVGVHF